MKSKIDKKILEATCDICGENCMIALFEPMKSDGDRDEHDIYREFEGMDLKAVWGFGSKKDGEIWSATVCESCVDKHLSKLINFTKKSYM